MRSKTLLIGSVLTIVGILLIFEGASLVEDLALATATSSVKTEIQNPVVLTVDAGSSKYISRSLSTDNLQSTQISYESTGDIGFYVMDEKEFEAWRNTGTADAQLGTVQGITGNFTFHPSHDGVYYFIFDNSVSNDARHVIFNLSKEVVVNETNLAITYLPVGLAIVGVVMIGFGLEGRKKPSAKNRNTLEKMAVDLGIDPKGLTDKELRKEIQEEIAT